MYIQAAEARPGNRAVVHHIVLFYKTPVEKRARLFENWIDGAAPGNIPLRLPEGVGAEFPPGRASSGRCTTRRAAKRRRTVRNTRSSSAKSAPNSEARVDRDHQQSLPHSGRRPELSSLESAFTAPRDVRVYSASLPHMHLRGKDFSYRGRLSRRQDARRCCRCRVTTSTGRATIAWRSRCALPAGTTHRVHGPLRQLARTTRPIPIRTRVSLGRPDLGRNDDRLHRLRGSRAGCRCEVAAL